MSIDQTQRDAVPILYGRFLKPSHRTRPEQLVGLGIYLLICIGFELLGGLTTGVPGTLCFLSLGFAIWTLWRRNSLRVLKLELSVFFSQFAFQIAWSFSHFFLHETLLALVALLLLWCNLLLATLLFWKKERLSGWLLFYPLTWVFYLVGVNMIKCISNP